MIRTFSKLGTQGNHLNLIKTLCKEPKANIVLSSERLEAFLLKPGTKQGYPRTTSFEHSTGSLSQSN